MGFIQASIMLVIAMAIKAAQVAIKPTFVAITTYLFKELASLAISPTSWAIILTSLAASILTSLAASILVVELHIHRSFQEAVSLKEAH